MAIQPAQSPNNRRQPAPRPSRACDAGSTSVLNLESPQQPHLLEEFDRSQEARKRFSIKPIDEPLSRFWHACWQPNRQRVYVAMLALGRSAGRLERFRCCGAGCTAWTDGTDFKLQAQFCRDRWCETCQARAAAGAREQILRMYRPGDTRHIVLTMKHNATPLRSQIKRLRASFQELRRNPEWKRHVDGGAAMMELKLNKIGEWHVHLHIIATGRYFDQRTLSQIWYGITGDSSYVYIKAITDAEQQVNYITKYVTKACDHSVYRSQAKLLDAMQALDFAKLMGTFGSWKHIKLRYHEPDPDPARWTYLGPVTTLLHSDDPAAARWREVMSRHYPSRMARYAELDDSS